VTKAAKSNLTAIISSSPSLINNKPSSITRSDLRWSLPWRAQTTWIGFPGLAPYRT
jgi:hypothetical protein